MSGEGLPPEDRERRRLELRREWTGRLIVLTPELRDPRNPDSPISLVPSFPWDAWRAEHPSWHHPESRRHRYALILESGRILRAYSVDSIMLLKWVVETIQPLMKLYDIEVPAFYEDLASTWAGCCRYPEERDGVYVEQTIQLSIRSNQRPVFMLFTAIHELAHCRARRDRDLPFGLYLHHRKPFRTRAGLLCAAFLNTTAREALSRRQQAWFRSYCVEDDWGRPIHPGPEKGWQFGGDGHYIVCPHPVNDPPEWWSREDW